MMSFFITLGRLLSAIKASWSRPYFRASLLLVIAALVSATIFYSTVEGWAPVDAFYFAVMTASTVGQSQLEPATTIGKIFTTLYVFAGVGVFVVLFAHFARAMLHYDGSDATEPKGNGTDLPDETGSADSPVAPRAGPAGGDDPGDGDGKS
ncbi:potassium channel family protein [Oceanomicrobium pacificus]|uniref:Two pore domain potassium channel family protein n=1 Tax=Oceanomicrobium pacificus TaxID=2692916 RepID=A0A6B0TIV4_9RHOB|nr:potassium channel family protein [Oceanomicrobium pacificus]MXU64307.1 two pore domain potassium channel family protein [Oceanomicrobium pacificus]